MKKAIFRPLVPTWQAAAAAIVLAACLHAFVKRPLAETNEPSFHYARLHAAMGVSQARHAEPQNVIAEFEKALSLDPTYADAANHLANFHLQQRRMPEAEAAYRRTLDLQPDHADARNNLGLLLTLSSRAEEAVKEYQHAIRSRPGFADARSNLGYTLMSLGKLTEAESELRLAIDSGAGINARHNLALCLMAQGRKKDARDQYAGNLKTAPEHLASLNDLAWLLATTSDDDLRNGKQALELARQADAITGSQHPLVRHTLAAALAETGQFDEAAIEARKAAELATASGDANLAATIQKQAESYARRQPWRE